MEDAIEDVEEDPDPMDGVCGPEDLPHSRIGKGEGLDKGLNCKKDWSSLTTPHDEPCLKASA